MTASHTRGAVHCERVSAERIRDELSKLLMADDPSAGLWFLAETGLSDEFLPELNSMRLEQASQGNAMHVAVGAVGRRRGQAVRAAGS